MNPHPAGRPPADTPPGHRFHTLDGLRGVAALAVLLFHIGFMVHLKIARAGYLGVDLFFCLSGFVIAYTYGARLQAGLGWLGFMRIRVARLYPVYFAGSAIGAVFLIVQALAAPSHHSFHRLALSIASALLFLPTLPGISIAPRWSFPINIPAWSLFFELAAGLVFAVFARRPGGVRLAVLLGVSGAALAVTIGWLGTIEAGPQGIDLIGGFPRAVFAFFAGVLVHRAWQRRTTPLALPPALWLVLLGLFFAVTPRHVMAIEFLCSAAGFPLLVYAAAASRAPGRQTARLFDWIGRISYPAYAVQGPLFMIVEVLDRHAHRLWQYKLPAIVGLLALVLLTAFLVERYCDLPWRAWMQRRRQAHRQRLA